MTHKPRKKRSKKKKKKDFETEQLKLSQIFNEHSEDMAR